MMSTIRVMIQLYFIIILFSSFKNKEDNLFTLTVSVDNLRNSEGVVQFAVYNKAGSFPDEHYTKYYRKLTAKIANKTSIITFENIPAGKYAVNILHDENINGKIDKGFVLPIEGIGFSNYQSIGIFNRPTLKKASFELLDNKKVDIKIIYL